MLRIVMTGGPGAGKTALLLALQARGYTIVGDTARAIIQDRRRRGLSPRPDAHEFVQEALRIDIDNYVRHAATSALSSLIGESLTLFAGSTGSHH